MNRFGSKIILILPVAVDLPTHFDSLTSDFRLIYIYFKILEKRNLSSH